MTLLALLDKIEVTDETKELLKNATLEKVIVNEEKEYWQIIIKNDTNIPFNLIQEIKEKFIKTYQISDKIIIALNVDNVNDELIEDYYKNIINSILETYPFSVNYLNNLKKKEDAYYIEINNVGEKTQVNKMRKRINELFHLFGFDIELKTIINEDNRDNTKKEIEESLILNVPLKKETNETLVVKKEVVKENNFFKNKKETDSNVIMGKSIKEEVSKINNIIGEVNSITIEGYVFGIDFFESSKSDFKIITLKVTDFFDSIYAKIFSKDKEDFQRLKGELKEKNWYKISGYIKNDVFAKELVLNVRDISKMDKQSDEIKDTYSKKRVELHTHSMMSAMDGVVEAKDLIKQARKFGHKAIAITDKHGCQAFPDMYHMVRDINKNLKEGEEPFKVIYGSELIMVDDTVNIVIRENNKQLIDETYVVFDFETTGFNAGGEDSIIEVGAVKLLNGEIIDRFSELINPHKKLSNKIIEVTKITDDMLQDKDNEENVIKRFIAWFKDLPMVAHNAKFDVSFLEMAYKKYNLGAFNNTVIDTLELSRALDTNVSRHSLSALVKRYEIPFDESAHHRADYDAEATGLIYHKMMKKLISSNIERIDEMNNLIPKAEIHKFGRTNHINILVKNKIGLKNLFNIVSLANTKYLYKSPRILRSEIEKLREGLLIGSGCYESEVFKEAKSKTEEELTNIISFYDYVEVQPMECYDHLIQTGDFANKLELAENIKKIIRVTEETGKIIVATSDVHHLRRTDKIYREVIVNQKVPGGGRHPLAKSNITSIPSMHFRTTDEMIEDFSFLDKEEREKIVIDNTNKIADMIEIIEVIPETHGIPFSPHMENSVQIVTDLVYTRAKELYGDVLPDIVKDRVEKELSGIINGGFDVIYLIAQKLVKKSNDDGYLVGSRGSVGSSFVAFLMGITEVNSLEPHYLCEKCHTAIFKENDEPLSNKWLSGYDLPDKVCPNCKAMMKKEGQDMPFATFLGFNADKVPDIDLNFSGDYQWKAHEYTKELFGVDNVYRAGTIGTVADKTAFGYAKGYFEDRGYNNVRNAEVERLAMGCTGVKRTTGQHPGGIVVVPDYKDILDFTPFQYPAEDNTSLWRTTHFDYHSIEECLLKLDILGHDDPTILKMLGDLSKIDVLTLPFDDKKVMSLLYSTDALDVKPLDIMCETGTLGLPELGTKFVISMLTETKPQTFAELVKISGLSHGTDVWVGNAQELIENKTCKFSEVIGCRDDIMVYLIHKGLPAKDAFKIMEFVRKGKPTKDPAGWEVFKNIMVEHKIPDWYIESCRRIKYMFPKAHACAYVMSALRIAWFKVYMPLLYYAAYFSIRTTDFDIDSMIKGHDAIKQKMEEIKLKGYEATNKENSILTTLEIALEMTARGFKIENVDLYKSHSTNFIIDEENKSLIPPFKTIDGLGESCAKTVVEEREKGLFLSIEDLQKRGKVSATIIEKMKNMGMINDMPQSSQLSLF
ncbi:MAG: PolC-type DNA polymerase III [Bacilli bacterium]